MEQMKQKLETLSFRDGDTVKLDWSLGDVENATERPIITFTEGAYRTINALVEKCSKEIAWNATVSKETTDDGSVVYVVDQIVMFPQKVTGASVDVDETEYSNWCSELDTETLNQLRFHGHSHVNMGVSPSGIDTDYQRQMIDQIPDFFIFMIFNKRGDMYACIYDIVTNIFYDNNDIDVVLPELPESAFLELADQLIDKYVDERAYSYSTTSANKRKTNYNYSGYNKGLADNYPYMRDYNY